MRRRKAALLITAVLLAGGLAVAAYPLLNGDLGPYERSRLGRWFLSSGLGLRLPAFGEPIAPIAIRDRAGRTARLPTPGRALLINYWASWCEPCRREMPLLVEFAKRNASTGPELVGIALDEPPDIDSYLAASPLPYRILIETPSDTDSSVRLGNDYGLLPYSVLVGADGRLLARKTGPFRDAQELEDWASLAR